MGKVIVSENVSLDGIIQDPVGDEGFRHGGRFGQHGGKDLEEWGKVETEEALEAEALLLGRRTDELVAGLWLSRDGQWADRLNSRLKYVVSSTLSEPTWSNATGFKGAVLKGDVVVEVSELKQRLDGDIEVAEFHPPASGVTDSTWSGQALSAASTSLASVTATCYIGRR